MPGKREDELFQQRAMKFGVAIIVGVPCSIYFLGSKAIFLLVLAVILGALSYAENEFSKED